MNIRGLSIALSLATACAVTPAPAAQEPAYPAFPEVIDAVIGDVVEPGYRAVIDAAKAQEAAMSRLCTAPGAGTLDSARKRFGALVDAFSRVEMFRRGPAQRRNRFEAMFYWPDRRSRALRQVRLLTASPDAEKLDEKTLGGKSVAVRGLLALDYVIAGAGSEQLATGAPGRCRYGRLIAISVGNTASDILDDWTGNNGYGALMRRPGPDNSAFRNQREVVQDILQAIREQLQVVSELKLKRTIRKSPEKARPKRAPFWRSGNTVASLVANVEASMTLVERGKLRLLLPEDQRQIADELVFELRQVRSSLRSLKDNARDWQTLTQTKEAHDELRYATSPLDAAITLVSGRFRGALGITAGFNALDGD